MKVRSQKCKITFNGSITCRTSHPHHVQELKDADSALQICVTLFWFVQGHNKQQNAFQIFNETCFGTHMYYWFTPHPVLNDT